MANINNNIRGKKLYKSGSSGQQASKGGDGEITVSSQIASDLDSIDDISELYNDDGLYQYNRLLLKQIEDIRQDVEELHAFITNLPVPLQGLQISVLICLKKALPTIVSFLPFPLQKVHCCVLPPVPVQSLHTTFLRYLKVLTEPR